MFLFLPAQIFGTRRQNFSKTMFGIGTEERSLCILDTFPSSPFHQSFSSRNGIWNFLHLGTQKFFWEKRENENRHRSPFLLFSLIWNVFFSEKKRKAKWLKIHDCFGKSHFFTFFCSTWIPIQFTVCLF
jgi:hypothetical protein